MNWFMQNNISEKNLMHHLHGKEEIGKNVYMNGNHGSDKHTPWSLNFTKSIGWDYNVTFVLQLCNIYENF